MTKKPYRTGWRVLHWRPSLSAEEIIRALGYNRSGSISNIWEGVSERDELYRKPVYTEAFEEWKRRLAELFPPPKPTSERLDEIEAKIDRVLAALEQRSELPQQMIDATDTPRRGLSFTQACIYIGGISRPKMYELIGDGSIQKSYLIGNRRYFFKEELDRFMEQHIEAESNTEVEKL